MAEMLKLDNIHKTFNPGTINEKIALNGVNLTLNEGDFVTVIGGNGAGKSTTLNAIAGHKIIRAQTCQIPRTCISGSDDRNRNHHVDRRKHGDCSKTW